MARDGLDLVVHHVPVAIDRFAGEITQVASAPETRTTLAFTGRVGEYGKADISGAARLAAPKQDLKAKVAFNNVELTSFYDQNREPVSFDKVAPVMYDAILASEDTRY